MLDGDVGGVMLAEPVGDGADVDVDLAGGGSHIRVAGFLWLVRICEIRSRDLIVPIFPMDTGTLFTHFDQAIQLFIILKSKDRPEWR